MSSSPDLVPCSEWLSDHIGATLVPLDQEGHLHSEPERSVRILLKLQVHIEAANGFSSGAHSNFLEPQTRSDRSLLTRANGNRLPSWEINVYNMPSRLSYRLKVYKNFSALSNPKSRYKWDIGLFVGSRHVGCRSLLCPSIRPPRRTIE